MKVKRTKIALIADIPATTRQNTYLQELPQRIQKYGVEVDLFTVMEYTSARLAGILPARRLLKASMLLRKLRRYDLVQVELSFPLGFFYVNTRVAHRRPTVVHTHGYDVFSVPSIGYGLRRSSLGNVIATRTWTKASHIITVCRRAKNLVLETGIPEKKISVLHNGVDTQLFRKRETEDKELLEIREGSDLVFLNVGSLTPVKNQRNLVKAFAYFKKKQRIGKKSRLVVCGGGHDRMSLLHYAKQLKLEDSVALLEQRPHLKMPELFSIADAFVLPSFSEGHPLSLLEAMSCELPAVASTVGGIPETIGNPNFLIPPPMLSRSPALDIYEKMVFLANAERNEVGIENRRTVMAKFTVQQNTAELNLIYQKIFENTRRLSTCLSV